MTWTTDCEFCDALGHTANPRHYLQNVEAEREFEGYRCHWHCIRDAESGVRSWREGRAEHKDGAWRWKSNGSIPPAEVLGIWALFGFITAEETEASTVLRETETAAFLEHYRANWKPPTGEALAELRGEVGAGVEMVNIITGERFMT
jgi:hypothetical protein